jgi:dTDP-4-amino-4,6-dideoxygalactose transaminase
MAKNVDKELLHTLHSGYIGEGSKVKQFAAEFGRFVDNKNVLPVSSGTMAIKMALRLAGVRPGSLVATTPMTCLATNEPILELGAVPVWIDVDPLTGCMTPDGLSDVLSAVHGNASDNYQAILCMHWGGWPCDISGIRTVAKFHGIPVIEDACQAIGSIYDGDHVGMYSEYACYSFQAIKHLTTGDGGALICNDGDMKRAKLMKWFGLDREASTSMRCQQDPREYGYKGQMNDISASIGLANIKHTGDLIARTTHNAFIIDDAIEHNRTIWMPQTETGIRSSYWLYTLHVEDSSDFIAYMKNGGVSCSKVHARNDTKYIFRHSPPATLPGVDSFDKTHVCIPCGWWLSDNDVEQICDLLRKYKNG